MTARKSKKAAPAPVSPEVLAKRRELETRLYRLAGDPAKADEFEAVRVELEALK